MDVGDYVEEQYGCSGYIIECFSNFYKIPNKYIKNKKKWLETQLISFTDEELSETWFAVDFTFGGQIVSCESKLILLSKANIDEIRGIL